MRAILCRVLNFSLQWFVWESFVRDKFEEGDMSCLGDFGSEKMTFLIVGYREFLWLKWLALLINFFSKKPTYIYIV